MKKITFQKLAIAAGAAILFLLPSAALAARTDNLWDYPTGGNYYKTNGSPAGVDILIYGSNHYLNWGSLSGSTGYGIRDNAGTMEFKNQAGSWAAIGAGGGSGTVTSVASADGSVTVTNGTTAADLAVVKAPKLSTARLLAGNSFDGSANTTFANKFIVQGTTDTGLTGAQFLGALGTGIVKNTTSTGILSIAANGTDYTLLTAQSCSAGSHISVLTAAGGSTCTADSGGGSSGLATTTPWNAGQLAMVVNNATVGGISTTTLAGTGVISITNTPFVIGASPAVASLTGGANGQVLGWSAGVPTWVATTTAGTGLSYNGSAFTVNTSQNIATLSNLTGNGFVKTSGGGGTLSIDTNTYITGNQTITLSGDVTGSGATSITTNVGKVNGVAFSGLATGILKNTTTTGVPSIAANGTDYTLLTANACTNQVISALTAAGGSTCSTVSNAMLANSTISGVSLGGTLAALTAGTTLTSGGTYTGATTRTFDIDLTHANSWTGLQQFANSSTTNASHTGTTWFGATATTTINADGKGSIVVPSTGSITVSGLATGAGTFVAADATGKLIATTSPSGGSGGFTNSVSFSPGTYQWSVPVGVKKVLAKVQAGGGPGGYCHGNTTGTNGGAAGGYAEGIFDVSATTSVQVIVGATTTSGTTQTFGTNSSFGLGTFESAIGGQAGVVYNAGGSGGNQDNGAVGGLATGGSINNQGSDGYSGLTITTTQWWGGIGGSSVYGGGGRQNSGDARGFGSGGGGGSCGTGGTFTGTGGLGMPGIVTLEY